ncbi:hypothetical protein PSP6_690107 [Paraburkholderia tropica]|uniref:hypothetical protein n=1 Tax=Paraburkholderia tropica TaxID=92647 RepID=UPI001CAFD9D3|nr:hypothetical protein [Paraburkholderia tropica]CAG9235947.1 hypothetical protein PSP6_690107 [Paraburkholderia tropica]
MSNELTIDEMIDHVLNWFAGARPGDSFTPRTTVELQTGRDNAAYAALVPKLPHIKKMADNGWIQMNGRYATLTPAGKAEMDRRGFVVGE